ncbi:MAG: TIGR04086 family membrane protein [Clostridia bacterium]|nr:TIGR04086 family membrane protein [Clostridia bacterium]
MKLEKLKIKGIKIDKSFFIDTAKTALFSLIITLLAVLILGIVIKFVNIPNNVLMPINQVIKVISVLIGCIIGIKNKQNGALKGGISGLIYTLISIFIFLILGYSLKDSFSFIDLLLGIIIGAISGVIAVNTGRRKY